MKNKIKDNTEIMTVFLSFFSIGAFILLGNSLTFNFGQRLPLKFSEIITLVCIIIIFCLNIKSDKAILKINRFTKFIIVLLTIGTLSLFANAIIKHYLLKNIIYAMFYSIRIIFLVYSFNIIVNCLKKYNVSSKKVCDFIIKIYIIVCIIGIIQLLFFKNAYDWYAIFEKIGNYFPNPDPHFGRLLSTYFDPNYLSACLLVPLSLSLSYWLNNYGKKYFFFFALFIISIILTVSRSGLLGAGISILILSLKYLFYDNMGSKHKLNKKVLLIYFVVFLGILILILLDSRLISRIINSLNDPSTFFRFASWKEAWKIICNNMIIGIGYNAIGFYKDNFGIISTSFGIDSSLLLIFTSIGIIGLSYFFIKIIIKIINLNNEKEISSISLLSIIISSLVICNFNNLLFYTLWIVPITVLLGVNEYEIKNKSSKIIVDARMLKMSGIGTYIQNLIKNNCYDIALGHRKELKKYFSADKIIDFNSNIYGIDEQFKFPYLKIYKLNPYVLHVPHYNVPIFYSGRMIVTIHDLTHIVMPKFLPNKFAYIYARVMIGIACLKAEKILTVSENTKKDIIKYYHVNPKKISVVYNGVGEEFTKKDKKEISYLYNKYSIPTNKKILMYVGNLKKHKNLENLLEAFSKLKNIENYRLILVGKAFKNINELNEKEKLLNIDNYVVHTGVVNQEELVDFYNLADLFIFPSLYEGFGLPILESLKCGTPVICSNTSSMLEVGGKVVSYFNPYDIEEIKKSIEKHCDDKEKFDKQKVEKWLKKFDWRNVADQIKKIL